MWIPQSSLVFSEQEYKDTHFRKDAVRIMWIIVSLDAILLLLGILMGFGVGIATAITTWFLEHAIISGIIFLILRAFFFYSIMSMNNLSCWITSIVQFLITPIFLVSKYLELAASNNGVFLTQDVFGMLFFTVFLLAIDGLWVKAAEKSMAPFVTILWVIYIVFAFTR